LNACGKQRVASARLAIATRATASASHHAPARTLVVKSSVTLKMPT
jgi:hypothetical protein